MARPYKMEVAQDPNNSLWYSYMVDGTTSRATRVSVQGMKFEETAKVWAEGFKAGYNEFKNLASGTVIDLPGVD